MVDKEFRKVGLKRHPELYMKKEEMVKPVFTDSYKETLMWQAAETIVRILSDFTIPQSFFVWHYVNALRGMDTLDELKWMEWLKFRAYYARMEGIKEEIKNTKISQ